MGVTTGRPSDVTVSRLMPCAWCGVELEFIDGAGWVDVAVGGVYDICTANPDADFQVAIDWPHKPVGQR